MEQGVRVGKPVYIRLRKDLTRSIKRGHAWLYSDAIEIVDAPAGSVAVLTDRKGDKRIASGIYDPNHAIPLRICRTQPPFTLDERWLQQQLRVAAELRASAFDEQTTGYRLVAGEGDGLPGLIIDVYGRTAVIKLDGGAPQAFYRPAGIAQWLAEQLPLECVVLRFRERGKAGEVLQGDVPTTAVAFLENGLHFTADVLHGQKTGFFLDQRDNRGLIRRISRGCRVLNLFSFNGGFFRGSRHGSRQSRYLGRYCAPGSGRRQPTLGAKRITGGEPPRSDGGLLRLLGIRRQHARKLGYRDLRSAFLCA
jgi:23S rRNA (cytosine1962-C5)-methyltransferase